MKMLYLVGATALAFAANQAQAATTIYTDQAEFNVVSDTVTEDFSDGTLVTGLSVVSTVGTVTNNRFQDRLTLTGETIFNFTSGKSAFGGIFDLAGPGGQGTGILVTLGLLGGGTETVSAEIPRSLSGGFWGFTSTNPFTSVNFSRGSQVGFVETYRLDNLQVGSAVPEPGTWALLLLGFFGIGGAMRAAKRRANVSVSYA